VNLSSLLLVAVLPRMERCASVVLECEIPATSQNPRDSFDKNKTCSSLDNAIRMRQEAERLQARFQARREARSDSVHDATSKMLLVKFLLMKKANASLSMENANLQEELVARKRSEAEKLNSQNEFFRAALTVLVVKHNTTVAELARVVQKRKRGSDDDNDSDDYDLLTKKSRRE